MSIGKEGKFRQLPFNFNVPPPPPPPSGAALECTNTRMLQC